MKYMLNILQKILEYWCLHIWNDDRLGLRHIAIKHGFKNRTGHCQEHFVGFDDLIKGKIRPSFDNKWSKIITRQYWKYLSVITNQEFQVRKETCLKQVLCTIHRCVSGGLPVWIQWFGNYWLFLRPFHSHSNFVKSFDDDSVIRTERKTI